MNNRGIYNFVIQYFKNWK